MEKKIKDFYNNFIRIPFSAKDTKIKLKTDIFSEILKDNLLYKYISFTSDISLNNKKLLALKENKLWFAAHYTLRNNDPTEFQITYNPLKVVKSTGINISTIKHLMETIRELNDLCCLSNQLNEYMWQNYANNHSGCCCVFEINDFDKLWPVLYCNKKETDFTNDIIHSFRNINPNNISTCKIAYISPVLKDKIKYGQEHEVRLLCSDIYDNEDDALGGKILDKKKQALGYMGTYYSYDICGLILKKIMIGKNTEKSIINKIKDIELDVPIEIE